jgi:hypothetical protein
MVEKKKTEDRGVLQDRYLRIGDSTSQPPGHVKSEADIMTLLQT